MLTLDDTPKPLSAPTALRPDRLPIVDAGKVRSRRRPCPALGTRACALAGRPDSPAMERGPG